MVARYVPLHGKYMIDADDGEMVLYSDYSDLEDRVIMMQIELAKLRQSFNAVVADWKRANGQ